MKAKPVIKIDKDTEDAIVSAIYTQLEELKHAKDSCAKYDVKLLKKFLKKIGRK